MNRSGLIQALREAAFINSDYAARLESMDPSTPLSTQLLGFGFEAPQVLQALSSILGVKAIFGTTTLDAETASGAEIPELLCRRLLAVPWCQEGSRLFIAFAFPELMEEAQARGLPAHEPCLALESDVREAINQSFQGASAGAERGASGDATEAETMAASTFPACKLLFNIVL